MSRALLPSRPWSWAGADQREAALRPQFFLVLVLRVDPESVGRRFPFKIRGHAVDQFGGIQRLEIPWLLPALHAREIEQRFHQPVQSLRATPQHRVERLPPLSGAGTQRSNLVGNPFLDPGRSRQDLMTKYFDPAAFVLPPSGSYGNAGRNILTGPGRWNPDFTLFKGFRLRESWGLQYRWEMFDAFSRRSG